MQNTPVNQRLSQSHQQWKQSLKQHAHNMRVAMPGIVQSFDATMQTVTVQLALKENVIVDGEVQAMEMPILPDVPVVIPRAGGFSLTLPIQQGDECLVIFADACIDAWWQSSGVQEQLVKRRHSLSDGFAIVGPWSQPRVLENYSTTSAQLRSDDGNTIIDVADTQVTITTQTLVANVHSATVNATQAATINAQNATVSASQTATVSGHAVSVTGSSSVTVSGGSLTLGSNTQIDGRSFLAHTHSGVQAGPANTGGVV